MRDNSVYEVLEEKPLTDADRAEKVLSDQIVSLGQSSKKSDRPDHSIRLVIVSIKPHISAGKYQGGSNGVDSDSFLRIATNLLDVPVAIIACLLINLWTGRITDADGSNPAPHRRQNLAAHALWLLIDRRAEQCWTCPEWHCRIRET